MARAQEERECKKHGLTLHVAEKQVAMRTGHVWRCKKCYRESVNRYRKRNKERLVQEFGGKCKLCGYSKCNRALDFHHRDPALKTFGIARGIYKSMEALRSEAQKCILVCKNCHIELEEGLVQLQSEG